MWTWAWSTQTAWKPCLTRKCLVLQPSPGPSSWSWTRSPRCFSCLQTYCLVSDPFNAEHDIFQDASSLEEGSIESLSGPHMILEEYIQEEFTFEPRWNSRRIWSEIFLRAYLRPTNSTGIEPAAGNQRRYKSRSRAIWKCRVSCRSIPLSPDATLWVSRCINECPPVSSLETILIVTGATEGSNSNETMIGCDWIWGVLLRSTVTAGIGVLVQRLGGMITVVDLVKGGPADLAKDLKIGQVPSMNHRALDHICPWRISFRGS